MSYLRIAIAVGIGAGAATFSDLGWKGIVTGNGIFLIVLQVSVWLLSDKDELPGWAIWATGAASWAVGAGFMLFF